MRDFALKTWFGKGISIFGSPLTLAAMFVQADFTVFSQATPFEHSPHFLDLLRNPQLYHPVQCMTTYYISEGDPAHVTPKEVVQTYR